MVEQAMPVQGEHSAYSANTQPTGYNPSLDDKKTIAKVYKLLQKAKKYRQKYDEKWLDYYKFFRGRQWKESRPSYRNSEAINFIFQTIQSIVPIMTDSRPKFDFIPRNPQDTELAKILSDLAGADWDKHNWSYQLVEGLYDAHFYGTGFWEMCFDPNDEYGLGNVCMRSREPFYTFPDPSMKDINDRDGEYFIYAEPVDVSKVKKKYPDKKEFLSADMIDLPQGDKTDLSEVRYKSPTDNKTIIEGSSAYDAYARDQVLLITCYWKCDDFDEEETVTRDENGLEQKSYTQKLKYPNGRRTVCANGVLLEDGPNPYDDGLFPYAKYNNYVLPREFWGISEVEQLQSPQKIFNKLISFSLDVLTLMGNPIWIVDDTSNVSSEQLFNRPGLVVEKARGSEVRREEGVQLQPFVFQLMDRVKSYVDNISGASEVSRGIRPEGVTAASAITALQESSQTRLRLKSRNLDTTLGQLGRLYINRVFQFYTVPRVFRITDDKNVSQYFKMHVSEEPVAGQDGQPTGETKRIMNVRPIVPDAQGQFAESMDVKQFAVSADFDVKVTTGSALPFAKMERSDLAFKLYQAQAIDQEELLKAVDYPNYEAVLQRLQERQQAAAQAQAQQQPPPKQ